MNQLYTKITNEYSAKILNWAIKKTGSRTSGEDLSQEVLLQVFIAVSKQDRIEKLENFVWKIAHHCWCNHVRTLVRRSSDELSETLPDGTDFARDYADNDALQAELIRMRRKIADLSQLQRSVMILHYIDGLSIRDVASKLNTTEGAVTWHLFDARKKVKKELKSMKSENSYVYSPGKLKVSPSGDVPQKPDTDKINDSLIRQNLCLLCCNDGKTIDELANLTGISKPYLEYDIDWLTEREFLILEGKRYKTAFIIINRQYFEFRKETYEKHKASLIDKVVEYLWQQESTIRKIGFHGCDFPTERLMWAIITMFLSYASWNSELLLRLKSHDNRIIHLDGGKYHIMAADKSDGDIIDISGRYDNSGWEDFWGIWGSPTCYWLGVYNFAKQEAHPEIVTCEKETREILHKLYCDTLADISADGKEKLAEAVENGLIQKNGDTYAPNFVIFTKEQLTALQEKIFAPLLVNIELKLHELSIKFEKNHKRNFPKAKQGNIDYHVYLDLWMFGIFTLMFAAEDEKLYLPNTPEEGVPLTLVLVK